MKTSPRFCRAGRPAMLACAVVLLTAWPTGRTARGQDPANPQIAELAIGFAGQYKVGCWNQLTATLAGGTEPITGVLQVTCTDSDGVPATFTSAPSRPVGVIPGQTTIGSVFIRPGQTGGQYVVRFVDVSGKKRAERKFYTGYQAGDGVIAMAMPSVQRLVVGLGPAVGLGEVIRTSQRSPDDAGATRVAQLRDPAALPLEWFGYEGVDTVILSTSQPEVYRSLTGDSARLAALRRWVELGGHVVLFCGREAAELIGPGGPLESLAPGQFTEMAPLRNSRPLESFAASEEAPGRGRIDLRVPKLDNVRGRILAHGGDSPSDLPLAVRTRRGLGLVTFVAVDPELPPLADWTGRVSFLRRALDWPPPSVNSQQQPNQFAGQGFEDLTGQLRTALDGKFAGVQTAPFALVALLVIGYIALIGPGDYFFVKRVLKRMELTWITFPLIVVLVSTGAYFLAYAMKGDQLRVNQVEIVDVDLAQGAARGTVWTHFFSPRAKTYDLTLAPRFAGARPARESAPLVAWLGMPGMGLGGMQGGAPSATLMDRGYRFAPDLASIEGMPVQEWSTKTLTARWTAAVAESLDAELHPQSDELLAGKITNHTGVGLDDCLLLYGRWGYSLGHLADGAAGEIDDSLQPKTVRTQLTAGGGVDLAAARAANRKFESGDNVALLTKLMMFYEAAGGRTYASAWNRYQHFVDLSDLLTPEQAILLARVDAAGGSGWLDGDEPLASDQDRRWTYYRFVIPVKPRRQVTVPRPE